jgi:hypothetical protein
MEPGRLASSLVLHLSSLRRLCLIPTALTPTIHIDALMRSR